MRFGLSLSDGAMIMAAFSIGLPVLICLMTLFSLRRIPRSQRIAVSTNTVRFVRTMRYVLTADAVEIRAGGSSRRIFFKDIVRVEVVNLAFNPISSYRLPGLALYDVLYSDEGIVTMFSTHALRDVVLIETADRHKYGISPEDEVEFVSDLRSRLQL
ncbi:MAG: PH domain-containing protein [Caldiserica bacterium]|nr:PH domain-containing protein [Caldisericota bacterium]